MQIHYDIDKSVFVQELFQSTIYNSHQMFE